MVALCPEVFVVVFDTGGAVEDGAESQTGDGQVLAGHHRGDRAEEQGSAGQRDGGILHLLPEGWCPFLQTGSEWCCPVIVKKKKDDSFYMILQVQVKLQLVVLFYFDDTAVVKQ